MSIENKDLFLAGSFLKTANPESLTTYTGRIFLIVEAVTEKKVKEIQLSLIQEPNLIKELAVTLHAWPNDVVTFDTQKINSFSKVNKIMEVTIKDNDL